MPGLVRWLPLPPRKRDSPPLPSQVPNDEKKCRQQTPRCPLWKQPETSRPSTTKTFEVQHARQLTCIKVLGISCQHHLTSWTLGTKKVSRHPLEARSRVSHRTKLLQLYDSPCSEPARGSRQLGHVPCSRGGTSKTPGLLMSPAENWRDWHVTRGGERGDWGTAHGSHHARFIIDTRDHWLAPLIVWGCDRRAERCRRGSRPSLEILTGLTGCQDLGKRLGPEQPRMRAVSQSFSSVYAL